MATTRLRRKGLTLVEVLVTTALLGFVAATMVGSLSGVSDKTKLRTLVHELTQLDARARQYARMGSTVVLTPDSAHRRMLLTIRPSGEIVSEESFADPCDALLLREGVNRAKSILFEPGGGSTDYAFEVKCGAAVSRVDVAGLTGWASMSEGIR